MHSTCYVIVPEDDYPNNVDQYLKKVLAKYYTELEVATYKDFQTKEYTYKMAKIRGFGRDLNRFTEYLKEKEPDAGIENELLYFISTYNKDGQWDGYRIGDITKLGLDLIEQPPFSVVTLDGKWHSKFDFSYKPILDFKNDGNLHSENVEPHNNWLELYKHICKNNLDKHFIILDIHS